MRTTIDLPDDLHRRAEAIARDTSRTLSETLADLVRRGLGDDQLSKLVRSERTGLMVIHGGRVITSEDVKSLDDEE